MNRGDFKLIYDQLVQWPVDECDDPLIDSACNALLWASDEIAKLESETLEQARLNGMGSEREARLLARVEELTNQQALFVIKGVGQAKLIDELQAELAALKAQGEPVAKAIHYPECWDTAAFPTMEAALSEVTAYFKCSLDDCRKPTPQPAGNAELLGAANLAADALKNLSQRIWANRFDVIRKFASDHEAALRAAIAKAEGGK